MKQKLLIYKEIEDTARELSIEVWSSNKNDKKIISIIDKLNTLKDELENHEDILEEKLGL